MFGVNVGLSYVFSSDSTEIDIPYTDTISAILAGEEDESEEVVVKDVSSIVEAAMPSIVAITTKNTSFLLMIGIIIIMVNKK